MDPKTLDEMLLSSVMLTGKSAFINLSKKVNGELIFKEIENSYAFWFIKKNIKDEIIRSKNMKMQEIQDMISGRVVCLTSAFKR